MDEILAIFLIMTVAITAAVILVGISARYRSRQGRHTQLAATEADDLRSENDDLKHQVGRLNDRIAVLERIVTDPATLTAREIETLR